MSENVQDFVVAKDLLDTVNLSATNYTNTVVVENSSGVFETIPRSSGSNKNTSTLHPKSSSLEQWLRVTRSLYLLSSGVYLGLVFSFLVIIYAYSASSSFLVPMTTLRIYSSGATLLCVIFISCLIFAVSNHGLLFRLSLMFAILSLVLFNFSVLQFSSSVESQISLHFSQFYFTIGSTAFALFSLFCLFFFAIKD
ncbi:hypothetical protein GEMRC1_004640 [Eukaryota sp. GEM-RC1]